MQQQCYCLQTNSRRVANYVFSYCRRRLRSIGLISYTNISDEPSRTKLRARMSYKNNALPSPNALASVPLENSSSYLTPTMFLPVAPVSRPLSSIMSIAAADGVAARTSLGDQLDAISKPQDDLLRLRYQMSPAAEAFMCALALAPH